MLMGLLGEVIGCALFGFVGAYLGIFKKREAKPYGLDLLWVLLLTIAASLVPYAILQVVVGFTAAQIYNRVPDGAHSVATLLGIVLCTYIAWRLVEWREAAQSKKKAAVT